jgi:hypothetical protein
MSRALQWLKHELFELLPVFVFFVFVFGFRSLTDALIYGSEGVTRLGITRIVIYALLVGKVVLLANALPFMKMFDHQPLAYETLWKTFVYSLAAVVFRCAERLISLLSKSRNWDVSMRGLITHLESARFWGIQVSLVVLFAIFLGCRGYLLATGGGHAMRHVFLDRRQARA